jgi:hypothetical protein
MVEGIIETFHLPVAAVAISAPLSFGGFLYLVEGLLYFDKALKIKLIICNGYAELLCFTTL